METSIRRPGARWLACAAVFAAATGAAPGAQAVTRRDAQAIDSLYDRSLDLTQSLTQAVGGGVAQLNATGDAQTLDCVDTLREAASEVSGQLMDVDDVAALAAGLRRAPDRRRGAAATGRAIARALGVLPAEARQVNQTAGLCLTQTLVQNKARDQLQLINDAMVELTRVLALPRR
jgi:hypothetical protein